MWMLLLLLFVYVSCVMMGWAFPFTPPHLAQPLPLFLLAYASFKAIESPQTDDDKQWLTYWTVIGFVNIIEFFADYLLFWIPFYSLTKTAFVLWLTLPRFRVCLGKEKKRHVTDLLVSLTRVLKSSTLVSCVLVCSKLKMILTRVPIACAKRSAMPFQTSLPSRIEKGDNKGYLMMGFVIYYTTMNWSLLRIALTLYRSCIMPLFM